MFIVLSVVIFTIVSCKKDGSLSSDTSESTIAAAIANTGAIAVGSTSKTSASAADSVYVINACSRGAHRDSVAFSSLPATVGSYLSANYSGYVFQKAFTIKDAAGTLQGYVVIIQFNGNPVGLKFDANGTFVQVLEQREGRDLTGPGWHHGGRFEHRDGRELDTVALNLLPATITAYMATNYNADTVMAAFKNWDGSFVIVSKNNGLFATSFTSNGNFISRTALSEYEGKGTAIEQNALPAAALSYLSTTYPNYVLEKAFSQQFNGTQKGYIVIIDANGTKYAVAFNASGNFVKAKTIR